MSIAIVDYQMGNLRSVQKAFEKVGQEAVITSDPREVLAADKVVLPGVGAFRDAIAELRRRDLVGPLGEVIALGKPFLGICLGLQLLFDVSYEDGEFEGLGIVAGEVRRFELPSEFKVPHMGWNEVQQRLTPPHVMGIDSGTHFYFVHSYFVAPKDPDWVALTADYGGDFCAAIWRENLFATQFHPEKSQAVGLKLLDNFAKWDGVSGG
jgi:glutamine amidotransferase